MMLHSNIMLIMIPLIMTGASGMMILLKKYVGYRSSGVLSIQSSINFSWWLGLLLSSPLSMQSESDAS